jgi:hypothetical protein
MCGRRILKLPVPWARERCVVINNATDEGLRDGFCCVAPFRSRTIADHPKELQQIGLVAADVDVDALIKNTFYAVPGVPENAWSPCRLPL